MDDSETLMLVFALVVSVLSFGSWLQQSYTLPPHLASTRTRRVAASGVLVALALLLAVLVTLASFDVRGSPTYLFFYMALGAAWLGVFRVAPYGVSLRDDVLERDNLAAAIAWAGLCVGIVGCFAGANVGDGPGFFCVLEAAFFASAGFFVTAWIVHQVASLPDHVTIDRDVAAGVRLASFFVATGVLWGRGAAGDFVSVERTFSEMIHAWPVALVVGKVIVLERHVRPTPSRPAGDLVLHGLAPAAADLLLVLLGLVLAGPLPDGYVPATSIAVP